MLPTPSPAPAGKSLYLAWLPFQRRQISMATFFDFSPIFMPLGYAPRVVRPLQYILQWLRTVIFLIHSRPNTIWVQLPQPPLLSAALFYRGLFARTIHIIADCHNPMLFPHWSQWPGVIHLLNRADLILVHTEPVAERALQLGVRPERLMVLSDAPADIPTQESTLDDTGPYVLFMSGFNADEPIKELLAAARLAPELQFLVAGETRRAAGRHDLSTIPPNLSLTGFLDADTLNRVLTRASLILCLTKNQDEQMSSVAEAVGIGKPMVLADTPVLRKMITKGAVFVSALEPASIAAGCRAAMAQIRLLETEASTFRDEREEDWRREAEPVRALLNKWAANGPSRALQ
jgi:glycosyltransferase involved in cell wall biosynthesis